MMHSKAVITEVARHFLSRPWTNVHDRRRHKLPGDGPATPGGSPRGRGDDGRPAGWAAAAAGLASGSASGATARSQWVATPAGDPPLRAFGVSYLVRLWRAK